MFRILPVFGADWRSVAEIVNGIMNGKTNNTGVFTLSHIGTTTTVVDSRVSVDSVILLSPRSDHAASELPHTYFSLQEKGQFTVTHRNHGHTDVTFGYAVIG